MKRNICLLGVACVIATSLLFIGSCSTDVEEQFPDDLSIESQIPRVKRTIEGIPVKKDECALYALMLVKVDGKSNIWNQPGQNAQEFYSRMQGYAMDSCDYKGEAMTASTILAVGQKFGLLNEKVFFDSNTMSVVDYFINRKPKMVGIPGHIGRFESFDLRKNKVKYQDHNGTFSWDLNQVNILFY